MSLRGTAGEERSPNIGVELKRYKLRVSEWVVSSGKVRVAVYNRQIPASSLITSRSTMYVCLSYQQNAWALSIYYCSLLDSIPMLKCNM